MGKMKVELSEKQEEMNLISDKLHHEADELRRKLHQLQMDNDRVVGEKSTLADKVLLHLLCFILS